MSDKNIGPLEGAKARLKVGLIVDSELVSKYVHDLVLWAGTRNDITVSHLIIQNTGIAGLETIEEGSAGSPTNGWLDSFRRKSFALLTKIDGLRLREDKYYRDHLKRIDLSGMVPESIAIAPIRSQTGSIYRYSNEDIRKIRDLDLDVLVHCGSGVLSGDILDSSRFGILSIVATDDRIKRGGPPGFWETYFKQDDTGFSIQQLTGNPDSGNRLIRGRFQTRAFYLLNQASLYTKSYFYLKQILGHLAADRALPAPVDSQPYFNPQYEAPNLPQQMKYVFYLGSKIAFIALTRILSRRAYRWSVAYADGGWKTLAMSRANKIRNPPYHFLADPFVIREGDRNYCFLEDYDYHTSRGFICVYELKANGAERLGAALEEPFHLSYPFLFRFDSRLYMCPETSESDEIRVYECVKFPLEWKHSRTLMSGVSAVDTMLIERDGLWWMFTNIDPTNTGNHFSELFIFYSDSPLSDRWHPHPKNPILIDSTKGRNGGIVFDDRWIYRVSQKQGFNTYGKGLSINKITVLNKEQYAETQFCSVEPNFFPNLRGCHHLHSDGSITVFDYLRYTRINY